MGIPKDGDKGRRGRVVIDGIPSSFERVQLFTGDRYTVFCSGGPIAKFPLSRSLGGFRRGTIEETREEWCRRLRGGGGGIPRAKLSESEIFDRISNLVQSR